MLDLRGFMLKMLSYMTHWGTHLPVSKNRLTFAVQSSQSPDTGRVTMYYTIYLFIFKTTLL